MANASYAWQGLCVPSARARETLERRSKSQKLLPSTPHSAKRVRPTKQCGTFTMAAASVANAAAARRHDLGNVSTVHLVHNSSRFVLERFSPPAPLAAGEAAKLAGSAVSPHVLAGPARAPSTTPERELVSGESIVTRCGSWPPASTCTVSGLGCRKTQAQRATHRNSQTPHARCSPRPAAPPPKHRHNHHAVSSQGTCLPVACLAPA